MGRSEPTRSNRKHVLVEAAARCFQRDGFAAASMRDIAAEAGMQTASIYYHFGSKDDLFVAVHEEGLRLITESVGRVVADTEPGWQQLEAVCVAHLTTLLEGGDMFKAVMRDIPADFTEKELITKMRDEYEGIFTTVIEDLDLPRGTDRRHLRLMLLGAMNWCFTWYRPGGAAPAAIAREFVGYLRTGVLEAP
ncbi:MAG: TetR/AcrR family transcriptional regulator [Acidimicrobiia bacterium]